MRPGDDLAVVGHAEAAVGCTVRAASGCLRGAHARAGKLNSNGSELLVFGKQFGKIFIGVQPTFGYEGDPMRLLFSRSASPHHGFAAYYTYLEKIFKVWRLRAEPNAWSSPIMPLPE